MWIQRNDQAFTILTKICQLQQKVLFAPDMLQLYQLAGAACLFGPNERSDLAAHRYQTATDVSFAEHSI